VFGVLDRQFIYPTTYTPFRRTCLPTIPFTVENGRKIFFSFGAHRFLGRPLSR